MSKMSGISVTGGALSVAEVVKVAREYEKVTLDPGAREHVARRRDIINSKAADPQAHYGVSTGFGALATTFISTDRRRQLQLSLIRSHAAGTGAEVDTEVVRALMLLRLRTLMTGHTGVRPEVCDLYAAMLNHRVTPVVHEFGSLGCSGDLAPLAHVALVAMGEGEARVDGGPITPGAEALAAANLVPLELQEKEGLALINGTDGMLGCLALAIHDATSLLVTADAAAAMSVESLMGTDRVFQDDVQRLRPHPGQLESARRMARLLRDSPIVASHQGPEDGRVQDAYSLRCSPQVHGAARATLTHATAVAEVELASAIDNPVLTDEGLLQSNGNFHGVPLGYVLDFLAIVVADVASISERRTDRFLDVSRNQGLPPFLAYEVGVDSGLMIAQYTAAAIVSDLKRLAHPASVDSIPSSALQEDHVSMGWHSAMKLRSSLDGLSRVLAIELLTASWGQSLRAPLMPGPLTGAIAAKVMTVAGPVGQDKFLAPVIEGVYRLVREKKIAEIVEGMD